jgi:predicted TIM-barrel fold metal-dependent hydrolase
VDDYPVIDADGHVLEGLGWLEQLPADLAARAFAIEDGEPPILVMGEHRVRMDIAIGDGSRPGGLRAGEARGGGMEDVPAAAFDPEPRLALMTEMGIDVSVLYPTLLLMIQMVGDELRAPMVDAYQRWMHEFCAADPSRLRWVTPLPRNDVDEACRLAERGVERGAVGVMVSAAPTPGAGRLLGDVAEDPIYAAVAAADVPMAVHVSDAWNSTIDLHRLTPTRFMWDVAAGPFDMMLGMLHAFGGGLLDRHPTLRVGFLEGNLGWLRYWLHKMEESYEHLGSVFAAPEQAPLEQFRDRCWISGETGEPELVDVARTIGADHVLFGSDFPHYESTWTPVEELTGRDDLTADEHRAILHDAPVSFYGLDPAGLPGRVR